MAVCRLTLPCWIGSDFRSSSPADRRCKAKCWVESQMTDITRDNMQSRTSAATVHTGHLQCWRQAHQSCGPGRRGSSSRRTARTGSRSRPGRRRRPCHRRRGLLRRRSPRRRRSRLHRLSSPARSRPAIGTITTAQVPNATTTAQGPPKLAPSLGAMTRGLQQATLPSGPKSSFRVFEKALPALTGPPPLTY